MQIFKFVTNAERIILFLLYDVMGSFKKKVAVLGVLSNVKQIDTGVFVIKSAFCK